MDVNQTAENRNFKRWYRVFGRPSVGIAPMPNTVICHYRVASGNEVSFESLLRRHWSILRSFDLVTDDPSKVFKGEETDSNNPIYFEIFEWRDGGSEKAHEVPDLVDLWEQMEGLCETRNTGPSMEFPHVEALRGY